MIRVWVDNLGDYVMPEHVYWATRWTRKGLPDRRTANEAFHAWLKSVRG